ncbi:MAG TPA: cytochrome c3 family protein [Vicinamibacterales bacterium]|jgi:hypothetical protein|nr:cytochrome c3 family protein [Vicinamibacterales bacterium]
MGSLFSPRANRSFREASVLAAAILLIVPLALWAFARTPAATGQYRAYAQPVPFAHTLHANGLRIDCRYCHAGATTAAMAGLPPTDVCVPCHLDGLLRSSLFTPVRTSLTTSRPVAWRRVTRLADFVFFNHAAHVQHGVECDTCHGPVELMSEVYQAAPLTMEWCLQCHRAPERYINLRDTGISGWKRTDVARSQATVRHYDVARLTSCTTCHR